MAAARSEEPAAAAVAASLDDFGPPAGGYVFSHARAPSGLKGKTGVGRDQSVHGACAAGESDSSAQSDGESDKSSSQFGEGREHAGQQESAGSCSSDAPPAAVLDDPAPEHDGAPDEPVSIISPDAMAVRASKMFVVGSAGHVASGHPPLASEATKGIVELAAAHMDDLKKAHVAALSASFGNFDRTVGLGWLIGDAVDVPLMSRKEAHAVGLKAVRAATRIKAELRSAKLAAQRAASKLMPDDPQRDELLKEAEEAQETIRRAPVDVSLPAGSAAAASLANGSRKRAREVELSPEDAHEQAIAAAEAELLQLQKAVKRAEAASEHADAKLESKLKVLQRIELKLKADCFYGTKDQQKQWSRFHKLVLAADKEVGQAMEAAHECEAKLLQAQLDASEADNDNLRLELEFATEQWGWTLEQLASK